MSTPSPANELRDFPDWLSPALVKDLRRGLKLKGFSFTFLALIIALTFLLSATILSGSGSATVMGFVWLPVALALLVVQPTRGLSAIPEERNLQTLPLIQLTRLNAFRILFGKWSALAFQTALLTVALIPYMVLGHFLGGFEFTQNVLILLLFTGFSLILTAITVALSVIKLAIVRTLMGLAVIGPFLITLLSGGISSMFRGSFGIFDASALAGILLVTIILGAFMVFYLISSGASQIAIAGAENHSTRRRLIALGFIVFGGILCVFADNLESAIGVADIDPFIFIPYILVVTVVVIDCVIDPAGSSLRIAKQFKRKGIATTFLAPGWPAGWFFAIVALLIFWICSGVLFGGVTSLDLDEFLAVALAGSALVFVPGAIALLLPNGRQAPLNAFFLAQLICGVSAILVGIVGGISDLESMFALIPHSNIFLAMNNGDEEISIFFSVLHLIGAIVIALVLGNTYRSRLRAQIAELKELDKTTPA